MIIQRPADLARFNRLGKWIYVFGRRKTGKTFFVKNFTKWDEYFFVKRDGSVLDKNEKELSFGTFFELFKSHLGNKKIVIDELQRLPDSFLDYLHMKGVVGNLTAVSSTLSYSKKLLGSSSPILGLFSQLNLNLVSERDILNALKNSMRGKDLFEAAVYLREPWLVPKFSGNVRGFLSLFLQEHKGMIKALIGEIFSEEGRQLSVVYEGILKAIASGKNISTEISSYLFGKNLIPKDNPGAVQRHLDILKELGIIEKISVFNANKFRYYHISPVLDLHFYLEEKYAYTEILVPEDYIRKVIDEKVPYHIEAFFANLLSKKFGLKKVIIEKPQIDIALVEFKRLKLLAEVKWKKPKASEIKSIEDKLSKYEVDKYIIVPDKDKIKSKIKILDCRDFI